MGNWWAMIAHRKMEVLEAQAVTPRPLDRLYTGNLGDSTDFIEDEHFNIVALLARHHHFCEDHCSERRIEPASILRESFKRARRASFGVRHPVRLAGALLGSPPMPARISVHMHAPPHEIRPNPRRAANRKRVNF